MKKGLIKTEINVNNNKIGILRIGDTDYVSLTDLAKFYPDAPANIIIYWMSNKETFDYIGLWEQLNNEVGYSSFTLSPKRWIDDYTDLEHLIILNNLDNILAY